MIKKLEELLYLKTKDSPSSILHAHWNYDKQVVPLALQAVSTLFPHYSLHDESHSVTILNNIVRIVGVENLEKLSAIDIWLILEASYNHDLGMVVTSKELRNTISSTDFIEYLIDLKEDPKHSLHEFAEQFDLLEDKIIYKEKEINFEYHDGIKYILAEFFRRIHSDRSRNIITGTNNDIGLSSPRGVIPDRIFDILGDICASHTRDFSQVLNLPICEVGIDVEDAHPRYVACLLRIGDLLDLDNNRFSDVMLRTLSKIPVDTLNHKSKHLSIKSFRVDKELIEATAICKDYDTANVTQHWFNYLDSEIKNQMINWNNIVPDKSLGFLPTIGSLKVELINYDLIDGKRKPRFEVDTSKALELLRGAGLYKSPHQSIREILQNAVDATMLRIWLENKDAIDFSCPQSTEWLNVLSQYEISISVSEKAIVDGKKSWHFKIKDSGIGLSSNDLTFLINTGSSSKNRIKNRILKDMPKWLRPSGIFGIGFQSIFLLTDKVILTTKSFFTEQFQKVELHNPKSSRDGAVLIKSLNTNHTDKPGTALEFEYQTEAIPQSISYSFGNTNATRIARNFDPFNNFSHDVEIGRIFDEIFNFSAKCQIPISLSLNNKEIDNIEPAANHFDYYNDLTSMEIKVDVPETPSNVDVSFFYKSQKVECKRFGITKFLNFQVNIHKDLADNVLTLNRNEIRGDYWKTLYDDFLVTTFEYLTGHFESIFHDDHGRILGSMFLNYFSTQNSLKRFKVKQFNDWENFNILLQDGQKIVLRDLINEIDRLKLVYNKGNMPFRIDHFSIDEKTLTIDFNNRSPSMDYTSFVLSILSEKLLFINEIKIDNKAVTEIVFSTSENDNDPFEENLEYFITSLEYRSSSARARIPCPKKYSVLRVKNDANAPFVDNIVPDYYFQIEYPVMLNPFRRLVNQDNLESLVADTPKELLDWVHENRYDQKTSLAEITETYLKFISETEQIVQNLNNEMKERWDKKHGI